MAEVYGSAGGELNPSKFSIVTSKVRLPSGMDGSALAVTEVCGEPVGEESKAIRLITGIS